MELVLYLQKEASMIKVRKPLRHRKINRSCSGRLVPTKGGSLACLECKWILDRSQVEAKGYDFEAAVRAGAMYQEGKRGV